MKATQESVPSRSEGPSAALPLAATLVAENLRQGFTTKEINAHLGWKEVNFKTAAGIGASLRREGIRSRCQSLNRYAYVLDNPTNLIDPLGLCADGTMDCHPIQVEPSNDHCSLDGIITSCGVVASAIGAGAAVNVGNLPSYTHNDTYGWVPLKAYADGSVGYVTSNLIGFSPLDIANAFSAVTSARPGLGSPLDPSGLTGGAADAYRLLLRLGVDPSAITIYQASGGTFWAVLTASAYAGLQQSNIASHLFDEFLHYPYTNGARDLRPENSLHLVWYDPRLTNYVGAAGVYMQFHVDLDNPWTGSFVKHMVCTVFKVGC
jgi:hypothetical protein